MRSNFADSMADIIHTLVSKGYKVTFVSTELLAKVRFLCWQHPELYGIVADDLVTQIMTAFHRLMG